jgi:hypothetical protein
MEVDFLWYLVQEDLVSINFIKIIYLISIISYIVRHHYYLCVKIEIKKLVELHILGSIWDPCFPRFVGMLKIYGLILLIIIIKGELKHGM